MSDRRYTDPVVAERHDTDPEAEDLSDLVANTVVDPGFAAEVLARARDEAAEYERRDEVMQPTDEIDRGGHGTVITDTDPGIGEAPPDEVAPGPMAPVSEQDAESFVDGSTLILPSAKDSVRPAPAERPDLFSAVATQENRPNFPEMDTQPRKPVGAQGGAFDEPSDLIDGTSQFQRATDEDIPVAARSGGAPPSTGSSTQLFDRQTDEDLPKAPTPLAPDSSFSAPVTAPGGQESEELEVISSSEYQALSSGQLPGVFDGRASSNGAVEPQATRDIRRAAAPGSASSPMPNEMSLPPTQPADPDHDDWADFDDKSGWSGVTGQSDIQRRARQKRRERSQSDIKAEPSAPQYARQNTNDLDAPQRGASSAAAHLVCLRGADEGREFEISGGDVAIGRDPRCSIVLSEGSASREHSRIVSDGDRYTLVDNKSANGTFVNGSRVDRARIRSGDEIGIGNAVFRFLEVGDVFKPIDASGAPVLPGVSPAAWSFDMSRSRPLIAAVSIVVVALIVVLGVLWVRSRSSADPDRMFAIYTTGVESFKRRDWDVAETQFAQLVHLDPDHKRGHRYMRAIVMERAAQAELARAQLARQKGQLRAAFVAALGLGDSVYAPEALQLSSTIRGELASLTDRGRSALEAGRYQEAITSLARVSAVTPNDVSVALLARQAHRAGGRRDEAAGAVSAAPAPEQSRTAEQSSSPRTTQSPPEEPRRSSDASSESRASVSTDPALTKAAELFGNGKLDAALDLLASAKAREAQAVQGKIRKFKKIYLQALSEHRAKNTGPAIKLLKQSKTLEAKITGGSSALADEIRRKIADMYYVDGMQAFAGNRTADAAKLFRQALSGLPDHRPSRAKLDEIEQKANALYQEGYVAKGEGDNATARKRWKAVVQMLPSDHEIHRKAKKRLDSLPR